MDKQREGLSSALWGSPQMPLDKQNQNLHRMRGKEVESGFTAYRRAAVLRKNYPGSRRVQVGLCGQRFTVRL